MYLFAVTDLEHSYQVNLNVIGGVKRTAIDILKICCLFLKECYLISNLKRLEMVVILIGNRYLMIAYLR